MSGSFDIVLDDGNIPALPAQPFLRGALRPEHGLAGDRQLLLGKRLHGLASERYDEGDYYREYGDFKKAAAAQDPASAQDPATAVTLPLAA